MEFHGNLRLFLKQVRRLFIFQSSNLLKSSFARVLDRKLHTPLTFKRPWLFQPHSIRSHTYQAFFRCKLQLRYFPTRPAVCLNSRVIRYSCVSLDRQSDRGHPLEADCGGSARRQRAVAWVAARGCPRPSQHRKNRESRSLSRGATRSTVPNRRFLRLSEWERDQRRERDRVALLARFSSVVAARRFFSIVRSIDRPIRENQREIRAAVFCRYTYGGKKKKKKREREESTVYEGSSNRRIDQRDRWRGSLATYTQPTGDSFKVTRYPSR